MGEGGKIGGAKTAKFHQAAYDAAYAGLYPLVVKLYGMGLSFEKIAKEFNQRGVKTRTGGVFYKQTVARLLLRATRLGVTANAEKPKNDEPAPFTSVTSSTVTEETPSFYRASLSGVTPPSGDLKEIKEFAESTPFMGVQKRPEPTPVTESFSRLTCQQPPASETPPKTLDEYLWWMAKKRVQP
jgi:hypothetical protein